MGGTRIVREAENARGEEARGEEEVTPEVSVTHVGPPVEEEREVVKFRAE